SEAMLKRDEVLASVLHPVALDLLSPQVSEELDRSGWLLAIGCAGNRAVLERYEREFAGAQAIEGDNERNFWHFVEEYPARFLAGNPEGAIVRVSVTLAGTGECASKMPGAVIARAGNGVCYLFLDDPKLAAQAYGLGKSVMEYGPESRNASLGQLPQVESGFPIMQKIKQMFDPRNLLNRGRYYG